MKVTVQVVVQSGDDTDTPTVLREVLTLDRDGLGPDTVGLQLGEAKDLCAAVHDVVVAAQVAAAVAAQVECPHCGVPRRHKDTGHVVVRSLFGTLRVPSPRWWHCGCRPQPTRTFPPGGRAAARADHPRAGLPASPLRRTGLLPGGRGHAGRAAAPGPGVARHRGAPPGPRGGPAPRRRAR